MGAEDESDLSSRKHGVDGFEIEWTDLQCLLEIRLDNSLRGGSKCDRREHLSFHIVMQLRHQSPCETLPDC